MFRSVRTVSRLCNHSNAPVSRFLLLRCCDTTTAPRTAIFGCDSSSNSRSFSSEAAPNNAENNNKISSLVKNFSVSSIFQQWKKEDKPVVDAIDLAYNTVVKVFTVSSQPRLFQPWQTSMQAECSGSGFVISGRKILTNAHVVANHTSVKVTKHGSPTKYKAKVRAIGHECDLAILEIDNEEFWEGMNILELGDIPSLLENVAVVGYPCGGDTISVTNGIVSRVDMRVYSHSSAELLAIQIDAAINSGNSGGPVILDNKVVGVAFQSLFWADGIGYIIPTPVIKHFLDGVEESGQHINFCSLNLSYQTMANPHIRSLYKMSKDMTGILINEINPMSDAHRVLQKWDVILAIDGIPIRNDSKVPFRKQEHINFEHLVSMKKPSETALLKVLRAGKEYEFNISLKPVQQLVPEHLFDKLRSYYIFAGFIFVPLSQPYINHSYDICGCSSKRMPKKADEQIVIISQILEDDINTDYSIFENLQVKKVNGVQIDNLKHLCEVIEECESGDVVLELEESKIIALNCKSAKKATAKILKDLKIPSAMSEDLQPKQPMNKCRMVPRKTKKK